MHPLVDACHIQDHAKSGLDHLTNGLALCKNLHAAFDSGLISLSDDYRVLISKNLKETDSAILKGAPYEKWYLSGRLGGIPGIQRLDFELNYASHEVGQAWLNRPSD